MDFNIKTAHTSHCHIDYNPRSFHQVYINSQYIFSVFSVVVLLHFVFVFVYILFLSGENTSGFVLFPVTKMPKTTWLFSHKLWKKTIDGVSDIETHKWILLFIQLFFTPLFLLFVCVCVFVCRSFLKRSNDSTVNCMKLNVIFWMCDHVICRIMKCRVEAQYTISIFILSEKKICV